MRRWLGTLAALALAACSPAPLPADPALWEVTGPKGEQGWLFGTVHALPQDVDWRTPEVSSALARSDRIVLEIAAVGDAAQTTRAFQAMSRTPGHPPLRARLPERLRPTLDRLLADGGLSEDGFADVETWAAAITLAQVAQRHLDSGLGIDRALAADAAGKPVEELEGVQAQFAAFDGLPEASQRALLAEVILGAARAEADARALAEAWRRGDMAAIDAQTRMGLLAEPTVRAALYSRRNQDWAGKIDAQLRQGKRPFVAVGAAHMAGDEGLPILLAARGYTVRRVP